MWYWIEETARTPSVPVLLRLPLLVASSAKSLFEGLLLLCMLLPGALIVALGWTAGEWKQQWESLEMPDLKTIAIAALLAVCAFLGWNLRGAQVDLAKEAAAHAKTKADHAQVLAKLASLTAEAYKAVLAEESRRDAAQRKEAEDGQKKLDAVRADGAAADRRAGELQQQLAHFVDRARRAGSPNQPAAVAGQAEGDPIGVLAELFRRADERAGILAKHADEARIAGATCERAYDALTPTQRKESP